MRIPRPTFSSAVAMLALFVALGGSSYAAIQISGSSIKNGTVTGKDLKNESVKGADVDNGTLTASDVKNGSLLAADFQSGQLPAGSQGPAGPQGPQGPAGATSVITRRTNVVIAAGTSEFGVASCLPGERAVGGGAGISGVITQNAGITLSEPREDDNSVPEDGEVTTQWAAFGLNQTVLPQTMNVHVLCASP
jgi:hypothetical protein